MSKQRLQNLINEIKNKQWRDGQGKDLMSSIQQEQTKALQPVLENMAQTMTNKMTEEFGRAVSQIKIDAPQVNVPETKIPDINIPEIQLPTINVPEPKVTVNFDASKIRIAPPVMPEQMKVTGEVSLRGVNLDNPLPVQLRDMDGKPINPFVSGSSVGKTDFFTIKAFGQSAFSVPVNSDGEVKVAGIAGAAASSFVIPGNSEGLAYNSDNPLPVAVMSGSTATSAVNVVDSSGVAYSGSNPLSVNLVTALDQTIDSIRVEQVSGANYSVYVTGIFGSTMASSDMLNGDNRLKVSVETGGSGLTDTELRASHIDVLQMSGSIDSVYVTGSSGSLAASIVDSSGIQYSGSNPFPVTASISGSTGSLAATILNGEGLARDSWVVSGITATVGANIVDSTGVAYESNNPFPVAIVSGGTATSASNIVDSTGVAYTGSNPLPISDAGGTLTVDGSVSVSGVTGSIGATILNGEGLARDSWLVSGVTASIAAMSVDSSGIGYSGSNPLPITWISGTGGGATTAAVTVDSTGIAYSGSNPLPITIISTPAAGATGSLGVSIVGSDGLAFGTSKPVPVTMVTGVSATIASANIDSSGVQYSGSNPMPTYLVANGTSSTAVSGAIAENASGDGIKPVQVGGIARQTNPGARTDGYITSFAADDLGRQLTRPVQVRDLIKTAYVALSTGTETTLLSAVAGKYHDLIYVLASNNSTAAVGIDLRAVTAGNILLHLEIPANSTTGLSLPVPMMGALTDASGNDWTADLPDITGTTVYVSALFSQEI